MTNPIKSDMTTPGVQMLKPWRAALGKAAFEQGISFGQKVRELLLKGAELEDPELAAKLKDARAKRFAVSATLVIVGLTSVTQTTLCVTDAKRQRGGMLQRNTRTAVARAVRSARFYQNRLSFA